MARIERHVVPNEKGGWDVKSPGASRASAHLEAQEQAVDRARQILRKEGGGELIVHDRDGRIRDKQTVPSGRDPHPPRG
jgi:hypothetical protein